MYVDKYVYKEKERETRQIFFFPLVFSLFFRSFYSSLRLQPPTLTRFHHRQIQVRVIRRRFDSYVCCCWCSLSEIIHMLGTSCVLRSDSLLLRLKGHVDPCFRSWTKPKMNEGDTRLRGKAEIPGKRTGEEAGNCSGMFSRCFLVFTFHPSSFVPDAEIA